MVNSIINSKNIREQIDFGPYNGMSFLQISFKYSSYLAAVIEFVPGIFFDSFWLTFLLVNCNDPSCYSFDLFDTNRQKIYLGLENKTEDEFIKQLRSERENEIITSIITNLKSKSFDLQIHFNLVNNLKSLLHLESLEESKIPASNSQLLEDEKDIDIDKHTNSLNFLIETKRKIINGQNAFCQILNKNLTNVEPIKLNIDPAIIDKNLFQILFGYCKVYMQKLRTKLDQSTLQYFSDIKPGAWSCEYCGGNETTGCLWNESDNCPRN